MNTIFKGNVITSFLSILCFCNSIYGIKNDIEPELKALEICLESNLDYREFKTTSNAYTIHSHKLISKVILIPIKKDVIDSTIDYKAMIENLNNQERAELINRNRTYYLERKIAAFILIVNINSTLKNYESIYFKNFKNVLLKTDDGLSHKLIGYTPGFDVPFNPGWNMGYLYFRNFRKNDVQSYSVVFDGLVFKIREKERRMSSWAFSFDETEINYLGLVQKGLSIERIRERYIVNTSNQAKINLEDVLMITKYLLKVLI